jgi:hypothetical protein
MINWAVPDEPAQMAFTENKIGLLEHVIKGHRKYRTSAIASMR